MGECETEYMVVCLQIVDNYDKVVEQVKREYRRMGGSTYGRLRNTTFIKSILIKISLFVTVPDAVSLWDTINVTGIEVFR